MAELHVMGQITSVENFKQSSLFCKWSFHAGSEWKLIGGSSEGQTQECCDLYQNRPIWNHPIDLHYRTKTLQGSPKLLLQVFRRDAHSRILFVGYGFATVPLTPGMHEIKCHTWKPIGGCRDKLNDQFLGMTLQLKTASLLANGDDRFELLTDSMGNANVSLHIIVKNFVKFGCQL